MKLLVAVPSYKRPYDIEKETGFWLKQLKDFEYRVFVEPQDYIYYRQTFPKKNIVKTENNCGLSGQCLHMKKYAQENGFDLIFKTDDDMYFTRKSASKKNAGQVIETSLHEIKEAFENFNELGGVNIAKPTTYLYNKKGNWIAKQTGFYGSYVIRTEIYDMKKEYEVFNDLLASLFCVNAGLDFLTYAGCYEVSKIITNKGGLQSTNRAEISNKTFHAIKKDFPHVKEWENTRRDFVDLDISYYLNKYRKNGNNIVNQVVKHFDNTKI